MKKSARKNQLLDKLHRGFVLTCLGVSAVFMVNIALRGYEYVVYVRPIRKLEAAKIEEALLSEGRGLPSPVDENVAA